MYICMYACIICIGYRGEPIWNTAKKSGLKTAVMYWPGSEVSVQGMQPDIWYPFAETPSNAESAQNRAEQSRDID